MTNSSSNRTKSTATERKVGQHEGDNHLMRSSSTAPVVTRRAALAGLGAGGLGLALAATGRPAAAQDAEMANHPLVGTWLAGRAPNDISVAHWSPDGNMSTNLPTVGVDADGAITHSDPAMGSWVPEGARGHPLRLHEPDLRRHRRADRHLHRRGAPGRQRGRDVLLGRRRGATVTIRDPNGVVVQALGGDASSPPSAACGWCPASPATTRCWPCSRTSGRHAGGRDPDP